MEDRRTQLIDTALRLFSEKGWENTTVKDITEAAGVAQGLVYHYFQSKEDLLVEVVERHGFNAELRRVLLPAYDRPAHEVLLEVAQAFYGLLNQKEMLIRIFVREAMTNPNIQERWVATCNEGVELLGRYLAARIGAGELRPHDTEISARMLVHPVIVMHLTGSPADKLSELVECILQGVSMKGGKPNK